MRALRERYSDLCGVLVSQETHAPISNLRNLRPKTSAAFWAGATRGWSARDVSSSQSRTVPVAGMRAVTSTTIGGSPLAPDRPATSDDAGKEEGKFAFGVLDSPIGCTINIFDRSPYFRGMEFSNQRHRPAEYTRLFPCVIFRWPTLPSINYVLFRNIFQVTSRLRTGGGAAPAHTLHQPISQIKP